MKVYLNTIKLQTVRPVQWKPRKISEQNQASDDESLSDGGSTLSLPRWRSLSTTRKASVHVTVVCKYMFVKWSHCTWKISAFYATVKVLIKVAFWLISYSFVTNNTLSKSYVFVDVYLYLVSTKSTLFVSLSCSSSELLSAWRSTGRFLFTWNTLFCSSSDTCKHLPCLVD